MRQRALRRAMLCLLALATAAPAAVAEVPPLPLLADGTTTRISVRADGGQATAEAPGVGGVREPSISANGRYVVFYADLELGLGFCGKGHYLRDLNTGGLEMISIPAKGCRRDRTMSGSTDSYTSISPDGRFVAFGSGALDLLPGRTLREHSPTLNHTQQIFLRDRARKRTALVSEGYDGQPANASAFNPSVSDDGRFVAFSSSATNLVKGDKGDPDDGLRTDIFLRDLHRRVTVRVGPNIRRHGRHPKLFPSLSGNGRYVVFDADDPHLAPHRGTGGAVLRLPPSSQVYVWDRITRKVELVSRSDDGYASEALATTGGRIGSTISRDGRWIVFATRARNLTGPSLFGVQDPWNVYLFDRVDKKIRRVTDGLAGEGGNGESKHPCISSDGRWITFASAASNLGDVDATPGYWEGLPDTGTDIYLYDRDTKRTRLVSRSTEGMPADGNSLESCPSNGGRTVVFVSKATNLVAGDTNGISDLFLRRYPPP